jgi:SAM-dependent methyltransferase
MRWNQARTCVPEAVPDMCCICATKWPVNQPAQDYNSYVHQAHLDSGACLSCCNAARHRLLYALNTQGVLAYSDKRILMFSPHSGYETQLVEQWRSNNCCVDVSDPQTPSGFSYDIQALPIRDCVYDVVFCLHVLEHVSNDTQALREVHRILNPNGVLIIGVPCGQQIHTFWDVRIDTPELRYKHYFWYDHLRLYGTGFADQYLKAFSVKTYSGRTYPVFAQAQRIPWTESIHVARKQPQ